MVASGSEVSTLEEGAALLRADGIKVRIVSVPSEGLFRSQSKEYQESVIPTGSKVFGLTAGLPVNLEGLVGANGKVWDSNHSVSPLHTRYWTKNSASRVRTYTIR